MKLGQLSDDHESLLGEVANHGRSEGLIKIPPLVADPTSQAMTVVADLEPVGQPSGHISGWEPLGYSVNALPIDAVLEHHTFRPHDGNEYTLRPGTDYTIHFDLRQGTFRVTEKGEE